MIYYKDLLVKPTCGPAVVDTLESRKTKAAKQTGGESNLYLYKWLAASRNPESVEELKTLPAGRKPRAYRQSPGPPEWRRKSRGSVIYRQRTTAKGRTVHVIN